MLRRSWRFCRAGGIADGWIEPVIDQHNVTILKMMLRPFCGLAYGTANVRIPHLTRPERARSAIPVQNCFRPLSNFPVWG